MDKSGVGILAPSTAGYIHQRIGSLHAHYPQPDLLSSWSSFSGLLRLKLYLAHAVQCNALTFAVYTTALPTSCTSHHGLGAYFCSASGRSETGF